MAIEPRGYGNILIDLLKGMVIGVANIIPGVSGGTMALVVGIYERLLDAIGAISPETIKDILHIFTFTGEGRDRFISGIRKIDALFLGRILIGALIAIVALANIITILLTHYHDPTYGFFFGLVIMSVAAPYRLISKKTAACILSALIAIAAVLAVSGSMSGEALLRKAEKKHELQIRQDAVSPGTDAEKKKGPSASDLAVIFLMGAAAISAMILPGVSGSFLLLLLGGYFTVLEAIAVRNFQILGAFAAGCLAGLVLFTRFLNFLLKKWPDTTMSFLVGLVIGSLWMIWPFKTTAVVGNEVIYLSNTVPRHLAGNELITIGAAVTGIVIVALLLWTESKQNKNADT